jgi:hypothetical protein
MSSSPRRQFQTRSGRQTTMAIQTQLVVSLVKNNEDYLGKVSKLFVMVR